MWGRGTHRSPERPAGVGAGGGPERKGVRTEGERRADLWWSRSPGGSGSEGTQVACLPQLGH